MDDRDRDSVEQLRSLIASGARDPSAFRAALAHIAPLARDACVDRALAIGPIPDDGPELPRGCVPYLPCPVDALLRLVEHAGVQASDVFVDVGSGPGRAAALVHLMTGARAIGLEIQSALVAAARDMTARLRLPDVAFVEGDAPQRPPRCRRGRCSSCIARSAANVSPRRSRRSRRSRARARSASAASTSRSRPAAG